MSQINESAIKTPGVYVTEIPSFPPSIAQVATAIPAFIGYTEWAAKNGKDLTMVPTRISNLVEYELYFGGGYLVQSGDLTIRLNVPAYSVNGVDLNNQDTGLAGHYYYMYDAIRHFYDNGGGVCYIVSVGTTGSPDIPGDQIIAGDETLTTPTGLRGGVKVLEKYDEPTLIVAPDAVRLAESSATESEFYSLQQMILDQCSTLQDRFAVFDLPENNTIDWETGKDNFRSDIGINNLNYAAAYTPWLTTTYDKAIDWGVINGHTFDSSASLIPLDNLPIDPAFNQMVLAMNNAVADQLAVGTMIQTIRDSKNSLNDAYNSFLSDLMSAHTNTDIQTAITNMFNFILTAVNAIIDLNAHLISDPMKKDLLNYTMDKKTGLTYFLNYFESLSGKTIFNFYTVPSPIYHTLAGYSYDATDPAVQNFSGLTLTVLKAALGSDLNANFIKGFSSLVGKIQASADKYSEIAQGILYSQHPIISDVVAHVSNRLRTIPPSGAMVGVYSRVDGTRGVWKAPANVSLNSVVGPSQMIDDLTQEDLNIDTTAGKSINAIRAFTGKGILVWGARTLDGNSNDFRYVSVRRFYIMVEESVKLATMQFVFEPNDANTWTKVRAMIENYLTNLWRLGALAGAKPEQSFYVKIGLGQTMTFDDILNGRMIVEIGMAPVRPAEFIILRFTQMQQTS